MEMYLIALNPLDLERVFIHQGVRSPVLNVRFFRFVSRPHTGYIFIQTSG